MSANRVSFVLLVTAVITADAARGQAPSQPAALRTPTPSPAASPDVPPVPPSNYVYESDGRRDPFVSLANRGSDGRTVQVNGVRPNGLAGLMVEELVVRGVVQSRGNWMAIVESTTGKAYSIRPGDRLMNGRVLAITSEAVVLMLDVSDPMSLAKQREVRKYLRGEGR